MDGIEVVEGQVNGVKIVPVSQLVEEQLNSENELLEEEQIQNEMFKASLAGHIQHEFQINKQARQSSGVEDRILSSLRAYNGEYEKSDLAQINEENSSSIFMNITATKAKVAKSWITDIYRSVCDKVWSIEPTPNPELPEEMMESINKSVDESFAATPPKEQPAQPAQPGSGKQPTALNKAQRNLSEINEEKRNLIQMMADEITKEAKFQMRVMEQQIEDQLVEGGWEDALNEFIEDFTIYPTAYMKGPVVTKKKKLKWKAGKPVEEFDYVFLNQRVDPLDMYPAPSAKTLQEGNTLEHVRYTRKTLSDLKANPKYRKEAIERALAAGGYAPWIDTGIESSKAHEELRGSEYDMNKGIFHGLHYFGSVPVETLKNWGLELEGHSDTDEVEVEAILVGNEVIKCELNKDPLLRRPYYSASFYNRPGSLHGRSLPEMMKDIQRMCNATARSLANNLGIAAGPMMEVNIDLLADDGDIEDIKPLKIFQVVSDPSGSSKKAVNFFQPDSNAAELLAVYEKFEAKADEVTGIPKYAYGNEKTAGAGTTATGLSLLLESATKVIKDAVMNIDIGLIKPRIEFQFYYNLIKNKDSLKFSGDVSVVPKGSTTLTIKAAQQLRRNEFLQITSNENDQNLMGPDGRASLLREIGADLGLDSNPIPDAITLKRNQKDKEERVAAQQEAEAKKEAQAQQAGLQATQIQIEGQKEMHKATQAFKGQELQANTEQREKDRKVEVAKLQISEIEGQAKARADLEKLDRVESNKETMQIREIARSLQGPDYDGI